MNGNWTEVAPDDLERMIAHVKSTGYLDRDNTIRVDFDDFCNLLRKLQEQSVKTRAAYEAGEIAMKEKAAERVEKNSCVRHCELCKTSPCGEQAAIMIRALPLSGAEEKEL